MARHYINNKRYELIVTTVQFTTMLKLPILLIFNKQKKEIGRWLFEEKFLQDFILFSILLIIGFLPVVKLVATIGIVLELLMVILMIWIAKLAWKPFSFFRVMIALLIAAAENIQPSSEDENADYPPQVSPLASTSKSLACSGWSHETFGGPHVKKFINLWICTHSR